MRCFYISLSYATFAIISEKDLIIETAPIAKWMMGKTLKEIKPWLIRKKARVEEISCYS